MKNKTSPTTKVFMALVGIAALITFIVTANNKTYNQTIANDRIQQSYNYVEADDWQPVDPNVLTDTETKLLDNIPQLIVAAKSISKNEIGTTKSEIMGMLGEFYAVAIIIHSLDIINPKTETHKVNLLTLKQTLANKQRQFFPIMRDRYGPVLRRGFFDLNITAKTHGSKATVVSLAGYGFYNNKAISTVQSSGQAWMTPLRFAQSRYYANKSIRGAYTYYDMTPIADTTIAFWDFNNKQHIIIK